MAIKLQIRRGTAANWTSSNPTLLEGEIGYELDTGNWKVGTGSAEWQVLPYQFPYLTGSKADDKTTLSVDQTNDRVGIGTNAPLAKLHVEGTAPVIRLKDSAASPYSEISADNTAGSLLISADGGNAAASSKIQFAIDGAATPQVTFTDDRKIGVGTDAPGSSIHVVSSTTTADINLVNSGTTGGSGGLSISTSSDAASIKNAENSTLTFGTNNTDRVTISAGGNVGIGTASPSDLLHVEGTSPIIRLKDSADASYSQISGDNTSGSLVVSADAMGAAASSKIQFAIDGSTKMTVDNTGYVGIGETDPQGSIHIKKTAPIDVYFEHATNGAFSRITSTQHGGMTIDTDPSQISTTSSTQFIVKVDGQSKLECQALVDSDVRIPVGQTLHVAGTLRPTLGSITANTISHSALENINTAGGALLGRNATGAVTQMSQSTTKSWLAYGTAADANATAFMPMPIGSTAGVGQMVSKWARGETGQTSNVTIGASGQTWAYWASPIMDTGGSPANNGNGFVGVVTSSTTIASLTSSQGLVLFAIRIA